MEDESSVTDRGGHGTRGSDRAVKVVILLINSVIIEAGCVQAEELTES